MASFSWGFIVLVTVLMCGQDVAQAAPVMAAPDEQPAYDRMLVDQARVAADRFAGAPCPATKVERLSTQTVAIAGQPDFAANIERLKVEGCGHAGVENIHVGRFGGSPPWRMVIALPGESLASMQLQESAWPQVIGAARTGISVDCATASLADVYVAARVGKVSFDPAAGAPAGGSLRIGLPPDYEAQRDKLDLHAAWGEVWPLTLCGQDRTMAVVFIPLRGQNASAILPLPIWEQIKAHGPGARPAPAP